MADDRKVIAFPRAHQAPNNRSLMEHAEACGLKDVILLGYDLAGKPVFFASDFMTKERVVWLLERAKLQAFGVDTK